MRITKIFHGEVRTQSLNERKETRGDWSLMLETKRISDAIEFPDVRELALFFLYCLPSLLYPFTFYSRFCLNEIETSVNQQNHCIVKKIEIRDRIKMTERKRRGSTSPELLVEP